jgi:large subunit ribosomal protein L20
MPRVRKGAARHQKHKRVLREASGFHGANSRRYRQAKQQIFHAGVNATIGRKQRKRQFRQLWITRISAACKQRGLRYSQLIEGLFNNAIELNRKMLADIAVDDPKTFDAIVAAALGEDALKKAS